jgi:glycosyltransferase involved in cell wall biosynthesis
MKSVTIALPVLNGGPLLDEVLAAVGRQHADGALEVLVCDSGSTDRSVEIARAHGAEVLQIPPGSFAHGPTRNFLMERASGEIVAFLTQDATPADNDWLKRLTGGFGLAEDIALVHGPYRPRRDASPSVARELEEFFAAMAPDGTPVVDRATRDGAWRDVSARATFFTDANGAVARWAWERVPFPDVAYAEDRLLARRVLEAGFAKAYVPAAAVVHSHDYGSWDLLCRYFDEFRGLRETFGHLEPLELRRTLGIWRREVAADRAWCRARGASGRDLRLATLRSARHFAIRALGSQLGSRADRLPPAVRRMVSLERRASFDPVPNATTTPNELPA